MAQQELGLEFVVEGEIISLSTVRKLKNNLTLITRLKRGLNLFSRVSSDLNLTSNIRRGF
jgi:hypothetical protein